MSLSQPAQPSLNVSTPINVLFLCTGNSARSILSEVILRDLGGKRFASYSAGSCPSGMPHPDGLSELIRRGHDVSGLRSKSWDEFSGDTAPPMDIIVTVCSSAAGETCPVWQARPGRAPVRVHWGMDDPAYIEDDAQRHAAFAAVYSLADARIRALVALPNAACLDAENLRAIAKITT